MGDQVRQFRLGERMKIKYRSNFLCTTSIIRDRSLIKNLNNWDQGTKINYHRFYFSSSTSIIIYSYSISSNFLHEIFNKLGLNFIITNNVKKAHIIIGLKNYLQQNLKLKEL